MENKISIQSYKLAELWQIYGSDKTYRTFQKRRNEFVEVLVLAGGVMQKRYLGERESRIIRLFSEIVV